MLDPTIAKIIVIFAGFAALDFSLQVLGREPRRFPAMRHWRLRGLVAMAAYLAIAWYAPQMWDGWLGQHTLLEASRLPLWLEVPAGFLAYQLGVYLWHRTLHRVDFLWRHLHQMHHSAERIDIWSAFYFHPLDVVGFAFVGSLALVGLMGASAEAATAITIAAAFCSMFTHANLKTPHWLGYLLTRPESHTLHHQREVHAANYGDIPLYDMLFGTFRNPRAWNAPVGFYDGASSRLVDLLIGRRLA